jgi:hypothetical protein
MAARRGKVKPQRFYLKYALICLGIIFGGLLLVQIFYPSFNLPLGTKISGLNLSGWNKKTAIKELNRDYANSEIEIFLADASDSYKTVQPADFGLEIDNTRRINAIDYPWYMRLVSTSLFWWGAVIEPSQPSQKFDEDQLQKFVDKIFGTPCYVAPTNARLTIDGSSINIGKSNIGGSCYQSAVKESLKETKFTAYNSGVVRIDLTVELPTISTADATALAMEISPNLANDLTLEFDDATDQLRLTHDELASWITFEVNDGKLTPKIDQTKSSEFYKTRAAPLVEQSAGVTTIIATEAASAVRIDGVEGRVINIEETDLRIIEYLRGWRRTVVVAVESTDPSISYVYSRPQSGADQAATDEAELDQVTEPDGDEPD